MTERGEVVRQLFDAKAGTWRQKYARAGALVARITAFRDALAREVAAPARVLEFGCGAGNLAHALHEHGYLVDACDSSPRMLEEARAAFPSSEIDWQLLPVDWERFPFANDTFEAVVASSVFEYVDEVRFVLREVARVLAPGGLLLFTVPDPEHPIRKLERWAARALQVPAFRRIASSASRTAHFARYLEVSKNRLTRDQWLAEARQAGLITAVPKADGKQRQPLMMLGVRKVVAR